MAKWDRGEKFCPRCGQTYSYIERRKLKGSGKEYFYAVHMHKEGGKWRKRRCYLGPKRYDYVATLQGIQLYGLMERSEKRLLEYLHDIISDLEKLSGRLGEDDRSRILELAGRLERLASSGGDRTH